MLVPFLSRFDFSLIHRPRRHSTKPDALSCRTDHLTKEEDNQDQVMLLGKKSLTDRLSVNESLASNQNNPSPVTLEGKEASFLKHIRECADQRQLSHLSVERTQHQVRAAAQ